MSLDYIATCILQKKKVLKSVILTVMIIITKRQTKISNRKSILSKVQEKTGISFKLPSPV